MDRPQIVAPVQGFPKVENHSQDEEVQPPSNAETPIGHLENDPPQNQATAGNAPVVLRVRSAVPEACFLPLAPPLTPL